MKTMKRMIHIIEDDVDILNILNIFFQRKGYSVIADFNGNDLDVKHDPCPEVYLIDINLIGKNGIDLCKMIKKQCKHIPVVLMSANTQLEKLAKECHADAFVSKPFDINTVLSAVSKVISRA
jgi:two-component system, OmpR family, response regulator VicR